MEGEVTIHIRFSEAGWPERYHMLTEVTQQKWKEGRSTRVIHIMMSRSCGIPKFNHLICYVATLNIKTAECAQDQNV